jgi:hypothetical protein
MQGFICIICVVVTHIRVFYSLYQPSERSRDGVVVIASSFGLDDRGVGLRVPVGSRIISSSPRPDRLWDAPSLLSSGYLGLFPHGQSGQSVKLTSN